MFTPVVRELRREDSSPARVQDLDVLIRPLVDEDRMTLFGISREVQAEFPLVAPATITDRIAFWVCG